MESDPQVGPFHDIAHLASRGPRSRRWAMQLRFLALSLYVSTAVGFSHPLLQRSTAFATLPSKLASVARAPAPVADEEFTSSQQLRAEVESPFSQVRLFVLPALTAAAAIATYFGGTALLAEAAGLREANPNSLTDLAIDLGSLGTLGFLWRRELQVREARLKRIAFGGKLASLRVQQLEASTSTVQPGRTVSLSDLRRGRGQARRVVVVCAPAAVLEASLEQACLCAAELAAADFLVVPLVVGEASSGRGGAAPQLSAPPLEMLQALAQKSPSLSGMSSAREGVSVAPSKETQPPLPWDDAKPDAAAGWPIALAQGGGLAWADALSSELDQATKQDPGAMLRGLTIVLKKNGRVGTRRLGMPAWDGLLADVAMRKRSGLDVTNI